MAVLYSPTALRVLFLAIVLACVAALTAPAARGASVTSVESNVLSDQQFSTQHTAHSTQHLVLADEWSWHEFIKFWQRQAGSMTGVLGTVLLVGAAAVIMILWKGK